VDLLITRAWSIGIRRSALHARRRDVQASPPTFVYSPVSFSHVLKNRTEGGGTDSVFIR
jgi:hypothetical protein